MVPTTSRKPKSLRQGLSQLSMVEHAICPLDVVESRRRGGCFESEYFYSHDNQRRLAHVRVYSPEGLNAGDEFYLWGLLALTMSQSDPGLDFYATPHFCLRELGVISLGSKSGKHYSQFRESIRRLAAVRYQNDGFYDPIRREHRSVSFGFFGYSLPIDPHSSRAWRIVWDPQFFELCGASGSVLAFDLATYRDLDPACRRLFLLLQKVFWRRPVSPRFDLRQLAVNTLGFASHLATKHLKVKLTRCAGELASRQIIATSAGSPALQITKRAKGIYAVQFERGKYFDRRKGKLTKMTDEHSPLSEPLASIGFDDREIARIVSRFSVPQIQLWCDVTLAAIEHRGSSFFRRSPQAFFMDNVARAAKGERTPPDWFYELRKREELGGRVSAPSNGRKAKPSNDSKSVSPTRALVHGAGMQQVISDMTRRFMDAGQTEEQARVNATHFAKAALQRTDLK